MSFTRMQPRNPGRPQSGEDLSASFAMLARLMQTVEDTTALHRCGLAGLERIREDGARLERLWPERSGSNRRRARRRWPPGSSCWVP